ncbi:MAG: type IX secretion system protein PorQ [Bacteroidales bacterium]|nr:type IX secretion system protein PorQ [Bacteroidales bacterium]MCF8391135.1 type IX secretion system protein PorQ [Bacteroidales bacterium]
MTRSGLLMFSLFVLGANVFSQIGGTYTYAFLNQTNSARVAALGGKSVSIADGDLNMPFHNPSLLNEEQDNHLVLNYVGYFADIKYGYVSYAKSLDSIGNFAVGLHYMDYGEFPYADIYGERSGNFYAAEYALNLIYSRKIDSFLSVGANLKPIYTSLERYQSFGLVADLGINYYNPYKLFSASLVFKNMGSQITKYYTEGKTEPVPFEIQAGMSQKLAHAPFRLSLTLQHLQKWNLQYDSDIDDENSFVAEEEVVTTSGKIGEFGDNFLRHAIFGLEFMPGKNFYTAFGYNYQRRQELKLKSIPAMVGFSWGFGIKVSKFHFSYGRATYHLAGASNHFSMSTNLSEFYSRR